MGELKRVKYVAPGMSVISGQFNVSGMPIDNTLTGLLVSDASGDVYIRHEETIGGAGDTGYTGYT